jgi:hypothetical protein
MSLGPGGAANTMSGTPASGSRSASRRAAMIAGLGFAALAAGAGWLIFAAHSPLPRPAPQGRRVSLLTLDRPFPAEGRFPSDRFVGPKACQECHPGECALYARSGHSRTLSTAARRHQAREVGETSVPDPALPGVTWDFRFRDGRLSIGRRTASKVEECVAEYAFGSGNHAITFVNVIDPAIPVILEHRMTYFAKSKTFGLTPGHEGTPTIPGMTHLGGLPPPVDARSCFECHSTQVSTRDGLQIEEDRLIPNVSCERCHGPGRAHVEAAHRGATGTELSLPFGTEGAEGAERVIRLCGSCHRHPGRPGTGPLDPENAHLARFQPVGILQSRCYRESKGAFSCVTCHDPHARASTDRAGYNRTCLACHSGAQATPTASKTPADPPFRVEARLPCPAEPGGDCIACHMRRVDAGQGILFADHWIRVGKRGGPRPSR